MAAYVLLTVFLRQKGSANRRPSLAMSLWIAIRVLIGTSLTPHFRFGEVDYC